MNWQATSTAIPEEIDIRLRDHLIRTDGQEDLCFTLYHPSSGDRRFSALIAEPLLPEPGDRQVHANASFNPPYFERVLCKALDDGMGIAFFHSHPRAVGWQGMSEDDLEAENGMAGAVMSATGFPLVGLTLSGQTGFWSGRHWQLGRDRSWVAIECENVRVVGRDLKVSTNLTRVPDQLPSTLIRTRSAWGDELQKVLAGLRVGIIGLGSVGSVVAEILARLGLREIACIDPDRIHQINLDRTLHAYPETGSVSEFKALLAARSATRSATLPEFASRAIPLGLQHIRAFRAALDCDVLFSCVDRPWARFILNHIAYAHLIPVIDGGISVSRRNKTALRSADWGVFLASPGRKCLECAGQFKSEWVAVEQGGDLDDPAYIESLPSDSPLRPRENVFVFSSAVASLEVLRLVQLVGCPGQVSAPSEERYSFPASHIELADGLCHRDCSFKSLAGTGDAAGSPGTLTRP